MPMRYMKLTNKIPVEQVGEAIDRTFAHAGLIDEPCSRDALLGIDPDIAAEPRPTTRFAVIQFIGESTYTPA